MSELKTHWKKLRNPKYLGEWDFQPGQELTVTFKSVVREKTFNPNTQKEDEVTVAYFNEGKKGLIMNVTNSKLVSEIVDSPFIDDWIGHKITLIVVKTRAKNEIVNAVRVKKPVK